MSGVSNQASTIARYEISPEYYACVMKWLETSTAKGELREKLVSYHLATNRKGQKSVGALLEVLGRRDLKGARVLDIGCGSGGCLIAAHRLGAAYVEGWEVHPTKLQFAKVNLSSSLGETPQGHWALQSFDMESPPEFGHFDYIICEEVLEHVKDVDACILTLKKLLENGQGLAYVSVPNGFSAKNVLRDPHLLILGLSLLDRFEGASIAKKLRNHDTYSTMMGEYKTYADYVNLFNRNGLTATLRNAIDPDAAHWDQVRSTLHELQNAAQTLCADSVEERLLGNRLDRYLRDLSLALSRTEPPATNQEDVTIKEPLSPQEARALVTHYGLDSFSFLVRPNSEATPQ